MPPKKVDGFLCTFASGQGLSSRGLIFPKAKVLVQAPCQGDGSINQRLGTRLGSASSPSTSAAVCAFPLVSSEAVVASIAASSTRREAPRIRPTAGAKRTRINPVEPDDQQGLLEDLDDDMFATSSVSTRASTLATWCRLHSEWFGVNSCPFPTWPEAVRAVAATMKLHQYRSWANYVSRAKHEHIEKGGIWDDLLVQTARDCTRSVMRGIGPPRQSAALDLDGITRLPDRPLALSAGGPISPMCLIVMGSFFLTREVELSLALAEHVTIEGRIVVWTLPASKTDPMAVGLSRQWGCVCGSSGMTWEIRTPCAFHAAVHHFGHLQERFGNEESLPSGLPLFPSASGRAVSKEEVVRVIEHYARALDLPLTDAVGRRRFGGHSLRVTPPCQYGLRTVQVRKKNTFNFGDL